MSLSSLLLGAWFVLYGVNGMGWLDVSAKFLALLAFVVGLVILIDAYRPIKL